LLANLRGRIRTIGRIVNHDGAGANLQRACGRRRRAAEVQRTRDPGIDSGRLERSALNVDGTCDLSGHDQSAVGDRRWAGVTVETSQCQRARAGFGQRTRTAHRPVVKAIQRLVKNHGRIIDDVALQASGVAAQSTLIDDRSAGVGIHSAQGQRTRAFFGYTALIIDLAGIIAVERLIEDHGRAVDDVRRQAIAVALQHSAADDGQSLISIASIEDQRRTADLCQLPCAGDVAVIGTFEVLIEDQCAVVDDRSLEIIGVTLQ
jgi:hypothetical protein